MEAISSARARIPLKTDLSTTIAGFKLRNPLLPGSGPPGANLRKLKALEQAGIGALLTKTISTAAADVPKPCMAFDGDLFFNIEKWSELPPQTWVSEIFPALQERSVPLIVSAGYTLDDLTDLVPLFDPWVDGFEFSTHYKTSGSEQLLQIVKTVRQLTAKPIFMKLSIHGGDIVANAQACEAGGADGVAAINSVGPAMSIDIEKRASRLGVNSPHAWLSGPAIKPIAMRAVYDIAQAVKIPVIASGGVANGRDVIEFMMAGAAAVQCCTSLIRSGPDWIGQTLNEIDAWCQDHQVTAMNDIIGTVVPHYMVSRETI